MTELTKPGRADAPIAAPADGKSEDKEQAKPGAEVVTLTHPKRGRTRKIEVDRADLLKSQGWVEKKKD